MCEELDASLVFIQKLLRPLASQGSAILTLNLFHNMFLEARRNDSFLLCLDYLFVSVSEFQPNLKKAAFKRQTSKRLPMDCKPFIKNGSELEMVR